MSTPSADEPISNGVPTLGGRQFWGDVRFFSGWRIQRNVLTGHYRLRDADDRRHASGSRETCEQALKEQQRQRRLPAMSGRAVVLIHGIGRSSMCFSSMVRELQNDDVMPVRFDYPSTRQPIPDLADYLRQVLVSLEGIDSIDFVCHSMGGLVLRSLLSQFDDSRLHRVVMLGVPNQGAELADFLKNNPVFRLILGPAGQQLITDRNGLIMSLAVPPCEFGILAGGRGGSRGYNPLLPEDNDSTVTVSSTRLPGATDFLRLPVIHAFLMSDPKAIEATRCFLQTGRFLPDREPQRIPETEIQVLE